LQLQSKLNLPRRTEVARWKACGGDLSEAAIANGQVRVPEIRVIEHGLLSGQEHEDYGTDQSAVPRRTVRRVLNQGILPVSARN
jgi:hypothetical protein